MIPQNPARKSYLFGQLKENQDISTNGVRKYSTGFCDKHVYNIKLSLNNGSMYVLVEIDLHYNSIRTRSETTTDIQ